MAVLYVKGLTELRQALRASSGKMNTMLRDELHAALAPIIADARSRFNALPGTGKRTAPAVSGRATETSIAVLLRKDVGFEFGREFGAKGTRSVTFQRRRPGGGTATVTRTIDYSRPTIFGPWTGNQFSWPPEPTSGHAFYPAAAQGGEAAAQRIWVALGHIVDSWGD